MTGCQNFLQLALSTSVATLGCLWALKVFPARFGLTVFGWDLVFSICFVWRGFGFINSTPVPLLLARLKKQKPRQLQGDPTKEIAGK